MFKRGVWLIVSLALAVTMPMLLTSDGLTTLKDKVESIRSKRGGVLANLMPGHSNATVDESAPIQMAELDRPLPPVEGTPVQELSEVVRFDIHPRWVMDRWPRVTTQLQLGEMEGIRVPLVTGTGENDLAGSLTYFFDKRQEVQRITFAGFTGDDRKLIGLFTEHYRFKPYPSLAGNLYLTRHSGKPTSVLRIEHVPVVRATTPHARLEVTFELNRPGRRDLSPEFRELLAEGQQQRLW